MNRFQFRGIALGAFALTAALAHPLPSPQAGSAGAHGTLAKISSGKKSKLPDKALLIEKSKIGLFVENSGQWNDKSLSHAHASGLDYWVTRKGVLMDFNLVQRTGKNAVRKGHVVSMTFDGGQAPSVSYTGKAKVKTDYLLRGVAHPIHAASYAEVHLNNIYPGIDVRNYYDAKRPRYDVIVNPGADASQIKLAFKGQSKLSVSKSGNLVMSTTMGEMSEEGLKAFTVSNGKQAPVKAAFHLLAGNKVSFDLGNYDHSAKLVIDPLIYGSLFGGDNGRDTVSAVTSTPDGGVYMTGWTESTIFPVIEGAYQINLSGFRNAYITLFRGDAYDVLYNSYIGGSTPYVGNTADDEGQFLQISPDGTTLWMAGTTTDSDFAGSSEASFPLITPNSWMPQPTNTSLVNSFLVEFAIDPTAYLIPEYGTYVGPDPGATEYTINGFQISPVDGSLLLAGTVNGTIDSADNVAPPVGPGSIDVWLLHLDPTGSFSMGSRYFGGSQDDSISGLATDPEGDFVLSGTVVSPVGSTGFNQMDLTQNESYFETSNAAWPNSQILRGFDLYAAKVRSDSTMEDYWSGVVGGSSDDFAAGFNSNGIFSTYYDQSPILSSGVATDSVGDVYILGFSSSFNYPRTSNVIGEINRQSTVVATEIATDASAFVYSTGLNTGGIAVPVGIGVDGAGNASITGLVKTAMIFNYPTPPPPNPIVPNGDVDQGSVVTTIDGISITYVWEGTSSDSLIPTDDAWLNVINNTATSLLYGTYIGGPGNETVSYPFVDQFGDIWAYGLHDEYFGYTVFPWAATGTLPMPKQVSYDTPFPTRTATVNGTSVTYTFITTLAFKINPDGPVPAPPAPGGAGPLETNWLADYTANGFPYINPTPNNGILGTVPMWESADGYVLRFRVSLPVLAAMQLNPNTVPGGLGASTTGTITLSSPAPAQGADVTLTINSNLAAAQFTSGSAPYSIVLAIAPGATQANFTITTNPVTATTPVIVEANYQGNISESTLTVVPWLQQFSVTPTIIPGGDNVIATVTLAAVAPASGITATITADNPADISGSLPILVTVPAGTSSVSVPITTAIVSAQSTVNLTATIAGVSQTQAVTLTPISIGISSITFAPSEIGAGGMTTGTITLASPAPDSGLAITVSTSDPTSAFFTPAGGIAYPSSTTVQIGANSLTGTFTVFAGTLAVGAGSAGSPNPAVTISAADGTTTLTGTLIIDPVTYTVSLSPTAVSGGASAMGTITLSAPTTADSLDFSISPSDTSAVPAIPDVIIGSDGATSGSFTATTNKILQTEVVTINISLGGVSDPTPPTLGVNAAGIASFNFKYGSIRYNQLDLGIITMTQAVPQAVQCTITYGAAGVTDPSVYFARYATSSMVPAGASDNSSDPVQVIAKRFTRPITVPIQATIVGSANPTGTVIQIVR